MVYFLFSGSSIGSALTYPLCGYIIDVFGWEMAFYVCGIIGTAWYVAWFFLVFDSPQQHPRITQKEKDYIVESLGKSVSNKEKVYYLLLTKHYLYITYFLLGTNSMETYIDFRSNMDEYFGAMGWLMGFLHINDTHSHIL